MKTDVHILKVLLYNKPIGTLTHLPGDKTAFTFDDAYIHGASRPTLSLSFKDANGDMHLKTVPFRHFS